MISDINEIDDLIPGISSTLKDEFLTFFDLITHYNKKINLVSQHSLPRAGAKHFADSYLGNQIVLNKIGDSNKIFDFGSGNGFPGIIFGMMALDRQIILVERDKRKAEFLRIAAHTLGLKNIEVSELSVGDITENNCSTVISRAMAPIPKFLLEARKAVSPGGTVFLFKGTSWMREFSECPAQVFDYWDIALGGSYELPVEKELRSIIECKRIE